MKKLFIIFFLYIITQKAYAMNALSKQIGSLVAPVAVVTALPLYFTIERAGVSYWSDAKYEQYKKTCNYCIGRTDAETFPKWQEFSEINNETRGPWQHLATFASGATPIALMTAGACSTNVHLTITTSLAAIAFCVSHKTEWREHLNPCQSFFKALRLSVAVGFTVWGMQKLYHEKLGA